MLNFLSTHWQKLRAFWSSPLGQIFINTEQAFIKKNIDNLFGYHLLLLGEPQFINCVLDTAILHRVWIHTEISKQENNSPLRARQDKLPILGDSIDLVYLAHCLEFSNNPHEILREAYRVLIPEGHVLICGFNPWSFWGVWRYGVRYLNQVPWDGRFISVARLKDWLALLGFDVVQIQKCFFRPPIKNVLWLQRLSWLEKVGSLCMPFFGGDYIVIARKRVEVLTPIVPAWRREKKLVRTAIAEPGILSE